MSGSATCPFLSRTCIFVIAEWHLPEGQLIMRNVLSAQSPHLDPDFEAVAVPDLHPGSNPVPTLLILASGDEGIGAEESSLRSGGHEDSSPSSHHPSGRGCWSTCWGRVVVKAVWLPDNALPPQSRVIMSQNTCLARAGLGVCRYRMDPCGHVKPRERATFQ